MHIAVVTTSYPDAQSGSEAAGGFVADFARSLGRHARVTVVAATAGATSRKAEGPVNVWRFAVRKWPLSLLKPYNPAHWWSIHTTLRGGARALFDLVASDRPDYILALWALPSGHWARRVHRAHGIPYGIWALGSDIWSLGRVPVLRSYLGKVLADAERRYADGLQLASDVESLGGATCDFLPSARQLRASEPTEVADSPPYRLGFLGRWHANKGVDLFLDALLQLDDEDWARIAEVRVCGGGPLEPEVRGKVDTLQALNRPVSAGGYLDTEAAARFLDDSDYVVLPSRIESIPVIFSDAAQVGRPLIATPVGDLPRLFERHAVGILADDIGVDAFARAIRQALRTEPTRFRSGLAEVADQFDVTASARRFAEHVAGTCR